MFGWLRRKPALHYRRLDDALWSNVGLKYERLAAAAREQAGNGTQVVVGTHTTAAFRALRALIGPDGDALRLVEAHRLHPGELARLARGGRPIHLLMAEFHETLAGDRALLQSLNAPGLNLTVQYHLSMEDAAVQPLITPEMRALLARLGHRETECLSHRFITQALENARAAQSRG